MSIKKQTPTLCKLYSLYKDISEEFLDETDVDSSFCHKTVDISHSQHRLVRVSKNSKESFATKLF